jgi:hypothetical protein
VNENSLAGIGTPSLAKVNHLERGTGPRRGGPLPDSWTSEKNELAFHSHKNWGNYTEPVVNQTEMLHDMYGEEEAARDSSIRRTDWN